MKLSLSIPVDDVEFLDAYAAQHALASRSAAVRHAIRALKDAVLPQAYAEAWTEFEAEPAAWDATVGDGIA